MRHESINVHQGEKVRDGAWHIPIVNARRSRLKGRIRHFRSDATRYLPYDLAWHHVLDRKPKSGDDHEWLRLAVNS